MSMEDARSGSGGCLGGTARDAEANRSPWENLSTLYFCAVMAQINGGPQRLPGNVKLRVFVPSPLGLSPTHTSSPSSSTPPNGQEQREAGQRGSAGCGRGVQPGSPLP